MSLDHDENPYGNTGTGDEYQVLATVKKVLLEFISEYEPEVIQILTQIENKARVFNKAIKKFLPTDYKVEEYFDDESNQYGLTLTRR